MSKEELLGKHIRYLEDQLEAAYWASGKWVTDGYDKWLNSLHEKSPLDQA
jgi:hypothetical protein